MKGSSCGTWREGVSASWLWSLKRLSVELDALVRPLQQGIGEKWWIYVNEFFSNCPVANERFSDKSCIEAAMKSAGMWSLAECDQSGPMSNYCCSPQELGYSRPSYGRRLFVFWRPLRAALAAMSSFCGG